MGRTMRQPLTLGVAATAITPRAFLARFTAAEQRNIQLAAAHDPAASLSVRQAAADLRALLLQIQTAQFVDLNDAATRAGVAAMEAAGLVSGGRSTTILDTAPASYERVEWW
jgi:hypothetical protein